MLRARGKVPIARVYEIDEHTYSLVIRGPQGSAPSARFYKAEFHDICAVSLEVSRAVCCCHGACNIRCSQPRVRATLHSDKPHLRHPLNGRPHRPKPEKSMGAY